MFLVRSRPSTAVSNTGAAPSGIHKTNSNDRIYGSAIPIARTRNQVLTVVLNKDNATVVDSTVTFDAGNYVDNIVSLVVGGSTYSLASDRDNLNQGEYSFDFDSKVVKANLNPNQSLENSVLTYEASFNTDRFLSVLASLGSITQGQQISFIYNRSTDIPLPPDPFLQKWNVYGSYSISESFGEETSPLTLNFLSYKDQISTIRSELSNGAEVSTLGRKWVVTSLAIAERRHNNQIDVSITLLHPLAARGTPSHSNLDTPIKLRGGGISTTSKSYSRTRSLNEIAIAAEVDYRGENISIRVPRDTSSTEAITVREIVDQRAITVHGFPHYTAQGDIEIRSWRGRRVHVINEDDLRESPVFNYNGQGNYLNGVQLASELRNIRINLDPDQDIASGSGNQLNAITHEWRFTNCFALRDFYRPIYRTDVGFENPSVEILRSPFINFDSKGTYNKMAERITYYFGVPTFKQTFKSGFFFTSADVFDSTISPQGGIYISLNTATSPDAHFGVYSTSTSDWVYGNDGFLLYIITTGSEKSRLQQETKDLEAVTLEAQARANDDDPSLLAQAAAYQFSENLPIRDITTYINNRFEDHYDDAVRSSDCEDEDFVSAKFARHMLRQEDETYIKENPKNNDLVDYIYPPIQAGRKSKDEFSVNLTSTSEPERYEIITSKQRLEGENLQNTAATGDVDYRDGRPSVQMRINLNLDLENNTEENSNYELYKNREYYLSSPGVAHSDTTVQEGSVFYPDIDNPSTAKAITETQQAMVNSQDSLTTTLNLFWRDNVEMGDLLLFRGQYWRVFDKDDARSTNGIGKQVSDRFELEIGLDLSPTINMEDRTARYCNGSSVSSTFVPINN